MKQSPQKLHRKNLHRRRRSHAGRASFRSIMSPLQVSSNRCDLSHIDPFEFAWGSRGGYVYAAIGRSCVELLALIWGMHRDGVEPTLSYAYNEQAKEARTEAYSDYPPSASNFDPPQRVNLGRYFLS